MAKAIQVTLYLYPKATDHVYQSHQEQHIGTKAECVAQAERYIQCGRAERVQVETVQGTIIADVRK